MLRIKAPHFTAGANTKGGFVCKPIAPIIKYMDGWRIEKSIQYCLDKEWEVEHIQL